MRVRVVRMFSESKARDILAVQQWMKIEAGSDWRTVQEFELSEQEKASGFALDLSLSRKAFVEIAVYENGQVIP